MRLASLKSGRDGELVLIHKNGQLATRATAICSNLCEALDNWQKVSPDLLSLSADLDAGRVSQTFGVDFAMLHSPLPRAFQWADASAFIHHIKLVRMARKAPLPETLFTVPLMYQGGSDDFLAPRAAIPQVDFSHGTDFEGEVAVITDDVPMGVSPEEALKHIVLLMLVNDVSLRGLIPEELAAGFGFFQSKPSSAFSPFAVTPDELGGAWSGGRVHLPLKVSYNGEFFGRANAGDMHFHFGQLIAHAARTRNLRAGTIIGSGTVSSEDPSIGSSCLAEKRMLEQIKDGKITTPFMKVGDRVRIEMQDSGGRDLFGAIDQVVVAAN